MLAETRKAIFLPSLSMDKIALACDKEAQGVPINAAALHRCNNAIQTQIVQTFCTY